MKTQIAVGSYVASSYSVRPTETWAPESNRNESSSHGTRSFLPTPDLQLRPASARMGWGDARCKNSGLPSSLRHWLASKAAVLIG
jgi:hypothetical protein